MTLQDQIIEELAGMGEATTGELALALDRDLIDVRAAIAELDEAGTIEVLGIYSGAYSLVEPEAAP